MQLFVFSCWSSLLHDMWFLQFHPKTEGDSDALVLIVLSDLQGAWKILFQVIIVYEFKYLKQQNATDHFTLR